MTPYPEFAFDGEKVNVTIRINEGKQYFINRITFQGNTTTRDSVIRRELRLYENSVFNTEALKYSVKRLNQLGYFKPLEDQKNITIDKTPKASTTRSTSRSSSKSRTATSCHSAPACRSTTACSGSCRSRPRTSWVAAKRSPSRCSRARASATTRWRSPSRSCSIGRLPARSICTGATSSISTSSRRGRPAATSRSGSRCRNFSRMFFNYSYDRVYVRDLNQAFFDSQLHLHDRGLPDARLRQADAGQQRHSSRATRT